MTCDQAKEQLVLLAYEELDEEGAGEVYLHLHTCPGCESELTLLHAFGDCLRGESVPEVSPNLLAASRMRLDEALDEASRGSWINRLFSLMSGVWKHLSDAPALATLLLGVGFLGGNMLGRHQTHPVASTPRTAPISFTNEAEGTIQSVSGVTPTSDPNVVQVRYDRVLPTTFQGSVDDPLVRQLLVLAAQKSTDNSVRATSVDYLVHECIAQHRCEHASDGQGAGLRDTLLVRLRYDKSPAVRLRALDGLKPFVADDQKVRDAVLESLISDRSADVRKHAIGMLTPVEGDSSVRRVLHTVSTQDENPFIRNASMQVLGNVDGIQ